MAIEKTRAYVLKTLPYRESSGIFYLLTERQGIVHGIAKGIRKKKTTASFLERGFLIETLIYFKPHRELHTLGDIHLVEYFPRMRGDLIKGAIRDAAFETILVNVASGFPCPELFSFMKEFCSALEKGQGRLISLLWQFYRGFSVIMGVGFGCQQCIECGRNLHDEGGGYLVIEKGGFACEKCSTNKDQKNRIPEIVLRFCQSSEMRSIPLNQMELSDTEARRITRLFASYCQYHCHTCSDYKALDFLDSLFYVG
jgi:DNA repair protein RecO (recombination protein O)